MGEILIGGTAAMLICVFLAPRFIEWLRERSFGQYIREEGPEGHKTKAGTPTMGGLIIFISISVPFLILNDYDWRAVGVFAAGVGLAAVGFVDDWTKVIRKRSLGLSGKAKLVSMVAISLLLWYIATEQAGLQPTVRLRSLDVTIDLGPLYPVWIYLVVAFISNAVNLTDGLDGLAAGVSAIVFTAYIGITYRATGATDLALLAACATGGCVGFLWYNAHPATVFMGDTGSLGLGGLVAGLAIMTKTEELLLIIGGIFVVEALSVIVQVFSFKTFRKRVFLMAPLHHHFEMKAWSETKIILRFWIIAIACSAIGFTLYVQSMK
ncbi:Phospho-N-acetylmuramoyl-pentapeptide-transferase [Patulibacter medicamentivorans]|uniref:Phospho-N-acetylmuramoyl-pentapeptide-transferase n=1 Tax=Patulibacter medicamentivorans TaxID=1097667 RepID=H0E559_9ACTN|nr:phospho-N-acetylmuramoyl-pentapeptide-transferase [Patulibacter medicamentivorans]EHN11189.1 Phospho-N-acetylmuramoyl-pentapeptide-transferase [Patulibacter medicamentivorans]